MDILLRIVRMRANGPFRIWKFRTLWSDATSENGVRAHEQNHLGPGGDPRMF